MNPRQLCELLKGYGYDGPITKSGVQAFLATADAPDLNLTDQHGKPVTLDDVFATKGLTLTVTRNDDEADTLSVVDGDGGEENAKAEEDEEEEAEAEDKAKRLRSEINALETKAGTLRAGLGVNKAATNRWGSKVHVESASKAAYRRAIKTGGVNPDTGKRCVFDDVDQAEAAGAWFRANAMGLYGKSYADQAEDIAILKSVATKGAVLYDANLGGSFAPPPEFQAELIDLQNEYGAARKLVPFKPIPKEGIVLPRWDADLTMSWATEGVADSDQDPDTSGVALYPKRMSGLMKISLDLLLADRVGMVDQSFRSFARSAANKEDAAFFEGDGTAAYSGIVGLATAISGGAGVITGASTWATMTDAQVQNFMGTVAHYAWQMGPMAFTMSSNAFFNILNRLNFAKGGITYKESADGNVIFSYNGMDFIWNNTTASVSAVSTVSAYFGAFAAGIKAGVAGSMEFRQSDQRYFDSYELGVRVDQHIDINVHDVGDSSDAGPITQLATSS